MGNLKAGYDPATAMSTLTMTFNYSGMGDGRSGEIGDNPGEGPIHFEAVLYMYSTGKSQCDFNSPFATTSGASLIGKVPPTPYPIAMSPVDSTTSAGNPIVRMKARLQDLPDTLLDVDASCAGGVDMCSVLNFCIQLQVFICQNLIDFVDVHGQVEFKMLQEGCDNCLKVGSVRDTTNTKGGFGGNSDKDADPSSRNENDGSPVAETEDGVTLATSVTSRKTPTKSSFALILITSVFGFVG